MAEVSMHVEPFVSMGGDVDNVTDTNGYASRSVAPEPNPPFVFPARRNHSMTAASSPATFSQRPVSSSQPNPPSARRPNHISTGGLPAFDFNPGKSASPVRGRTTPPESPTPGMSVPLRGGGHRRGGSEFIGGDGEAGGPGLMSTSPTKREGALTVPTSTTARGPPAGRRGHSHRRSGAISSHDVSLILKPSELRVIPRAGSAPNTPSELDAQMSPTLPHERVEGAPSPPARPSPVLRNRRESAPASGQVRARVGFSDTLEFIPRPLSIVSSETSSSMSPIQGSHSVSDSITSLVSAGTASPPQAKSGRSTLATTSEDQVWRPRPQTAGAVMTGSVSNDTNVVDGNLTLKDRPRSASTSRSDLNATERSPCGDYKSSIDTLGDEPRSMETSRSSSPVAGGPDPGPHWTQSPSVDVSEPSVAGPSSSARTKVPSERRVPKKQKKVKSWAGSILSRKGRYRSQKQKTVGRRTPTPPLRNYVPAGDSDDFDVNFDEDPTFVISTTTAQITPPPHLRTGFADWKPREPSSSTDADTMSPVIDLDAALGPFNTPSLGSQFRNALDRGFPVGKRAMHSSGATGGFIGPGMHYHRRAESAPEMVAFNVGHFGLHRLASSSTMADVFEEDEEEDEETMETGSQGRSLENNGQAEVEGLGIGVQVVDADDMSSTGALSWSWQENSEPRRGIKRKGSGLSDTERRQLVSAVKQGTSSGSLNSEAIIEESSSVEIVPIHEEPRTSVVSKSSDDSTITLSLSHGPFIQRPASAPIDLVWSASELQPETPRTISSTLSSPGFTNSSFDGPRVATPSSSFTDRRTLNSLFNGEPGPELRMSVEDVPSLTSSASTMTNIHPVGRFSSSAGTRSSAERSLSVSAAETTRTRNASTGKRSSLASLSRLVGGSYGERSKLFIEERAQPDNAAKPEKKKGNRMSRLIHFWKSKEKLNLD